MRECSTEIEEREYAIKFDLLMFYHMQLIGYISWNRDY